MSDDNEAPMSSTEPGDPLADPNDEYLETIKAWHKDATRHLTDWREEAVESFGFVSGDGQWSEEDKNLLAEQGRPVVVFNRTGPVVDSVSGMEVNHRNDTTYIPRQVDQTGYTDFLTNAGKFFRDESEAEDEESDAFFDCVVCGVGITETRPDFEEDPEGLIPVERIDPVSAWWDPSARKRNITDRRYCGYDKEMSLDDAKAMFPHIEDPEDLDATWAHVTRLNAQDPHDATPQLAYNQGDQGGKTQSSRKKVTIVYCEWWDREQYHVAIDPFTGERVEMRPDQAVTLKERLAKFKIPLETVGLTRKVFKNAFVGKTILTTGPGRCPHDFTLNFITAKRDRNSNTWYGIVRAMKDPQRWANKFFSQILYIINSNAKGGVIAERSAFEDPRKAEADWARADAMIWAKDGALSAGKIQPRTAITYPAGLDKMMEYAAGSINDTTGINLEVLGLADREQAGVLEYQRKQSGMTVLATLFDSLRRYRKQQGRAMLYIMRNYIPQGRLIRIDGENGPQYAPFIKDESNTKYDVIVDESPSSPNQKEQIWSMVMQMMPMLAKAQIPGQMWAEILKYSPLPDSFATKIGGFLVNQPAVSPQAQQQIEQLTKQLQGMQQQLQQGEQEKAQLRASNAAKLQQGQIDLQMRQQQLQADGEMAQREMALKEQIAAKELEIQQARAMAELEIKRVSAQFDMDRERAEVETDRQTAGQQMALEREKAANQIELERDKMGLEKAKTGASGPKKKRTIRVRKAKDAEGNEHIAGAQIVHPDGNVTEIEIAPAE